MTTAEAVARLGVKKETLYAYVSRGLLRSERLPGVRTSRFLRGDVERLAARTRQTKRAGYLDIVIDSELTLLDPAGRLFYRGWDAIEAASSASYEEVAEWLWTGARNPPRPWVASAAGLQAGRGAQGRLPDHCSLADRLRVIVAAVAATDPLRHDRRPQAVAATARSLIAALVESLPGPDEGVNRPIAARLWPRLSPLPPTPARVSGLDDALVLLAEHELAASTLAARVAASTWADPYLVVLAGLSAMGGSLHGAAGEAVRSLLAQVRGGKPPEVVIGEQLRRAEPVPGFGHAVYRGPDPRTAPLLRAVERMSPDPGVWRAAQGLIAVMQAREQPHPNADFALATLAEAAGMPLGGGEAVFAVARCAGWIAHGIEEYGHRLRFRPRAAYTGPAPSDG